MKRIICAILLLAASVAAFAQTSIKVQAPNLVTTSEQFNVTFIIEGEHSVSGFEWNCPDDFNFVWGPQKGTSTSISIINGKKTTSVQNTYTYILSPKSAGNFQIPSATATVKGETITSRPAGIQVVADQSQQGGSRQSSQQSRQGAREEQSDVTSADGQDIFMRFTLSKTNVVVGESINAVLKLYQRANISGFEDVKFPSFNGFWSQETQTPSNIEFHRENIGGVIYEAAVIRGYTLIPQQAGDRVIDPAELTCVVNIRAPSTGMGSIFDSFFMDDYRTVRKHVATSPVTVHVRPLPAGAPASFGGGVGSFKMNVSLTRDSLQTHDAASLKVTVTGKGNVALLEAPKISFPPDFEVYDTKMSDSGGARVFEYPFIPRSHGEFVIGPVEYSYYDIASGKYVTLRSQELPVNVARGQADAVQDVSGGQLVQGTVRKDVRNLGSDIRFISTKLPSFSATGKFFVQSPAFIALCALLVLLAAGLYFLLRSLAARRSDVVLTRRRSATKMARKRLEAAGTYLKKDLHSAFYEELHRALLGYVSDKLNMDVTDMSRGNIEQRLTESGVPSGPASEFTSLVEACEYARYSPDQGHEAMNAHYESAVNVISAIDSSMKHSTRKAGGAAAAVLALLLVPVFSDARQIDYPDSLWNSGTRAYMDGNWEKAAKEWSAITALGVESSVLYYNLGNAYFKGGDNARAILSYERALKLDPSYADARFNLEYVNGFIQDKIEPVPEFFLRSWNRKLCYMLPSDSWAVLFLVLLALTLAGVLTFLLSGSNALRKMGFFGAVTALVLSVFCLIFAISQKQNYLHTDEAVVTRAVTSVKSSPSTDSAVDLFVLHEGTKVRVQDQVGEWKNIRLADGREGWIQGKDLEII